MSHPRTTARCYTVTTQTTMTSSTSSVSRAIVSRTVPTTGNNYVSAAAPITPASLSTSRPAAVAVLTRALVRTTTAPRAAVRPCLRQDGAFWGWALATQPSCSKKNSKSTKTGTGNHIYSYPVNQVPHPPSAAALMRATERWQLTGLPSHP